MIENRLDPPIFIVGCSHSGTSLMLAILGAHSKIYAIRHESKLAMGRIHDELVAEFNFHAVISEKKRWVEKTANHIYCLDEIIEYFPEAKILIMLRDGRDVASSLYARQGKIRDGIKKWVETSSIMLENRDCPNVFVIKYEDLITDFESTMRDVFSFLDEEYEEGIKDFYKYYPQDLEKPSNDDNKYHRQFRLWQLSQPLFDGRGRWMELTEDEIALVYKLGGEMLIELGYISEFE